ncbi:hypothetical protein Psta_1063 [Pirellula staleyi DSM 6068]|uniref:Carboxypeptidase regulatory-like domain-containing protein n=1 Tax=Pirellula staleyi (strain ATCC 27377 / DSM 6068 / ICPB 4128) TaxID=530564 RepID=D2R8C9_PIRSD|nr:hypothetical protein [Pirellula staleyi]ADB15746.1 hypothetical protein Psta_1063 [Pirellula staleyi DSM 6068]
MTCSRLGWLSLCFSLALLVTIAGCGDSSGEVIVTGNVTLDGNPIETGSITFLSEAADGPTGGGVIKDGKYEARVLPGKKIVMVIGSKVVGERLRLEGVADSGTVPDLRTITPPIYNTREHSPVRANIEGPASDLNFSLTADGKGS